MKRNDIVLVWFGNDVLEVRIFKFKMLIKIRKYIRYDNLINCTILKVDDKWSGNYHGKKKNRT